MTVWQDIDVQEGDVAQTTCDCCGKTTIRAEGELYANASPSGWFDAYFTKGCPSTWPVLNLYGGDWAENVSADKRWGARVLWHSEGCQLLDWEQDARKNITSFTPLGRNDILGRRIEPEFWAMVDAIIMKDSRLKEIDPS